MSVVQLHRINPSFSPPVQDLSWCGQGWEAQSWRVYSGNASCGHGKDWPAAATHTANRAGPALTEVCTHMWLIPLFTRERGIWFMFCKAGTTLICIFFNERLLSCLFGFFVLNDSQPDFSKRWQGHSERIYFVSDWRPGSGAAAENQTQLSVLASPRFTAVSCLLLFWIHYLQLDLHLLLNVDCDLSLYVCCRNTKHWLRPL